MSAVARIPELLFCVVPNDAQRRPIGSGKRRLRRVHRIASMCKATQCANIMYVVACLARLVGLPIDFATTAMADGGTAESGQGI